jgi:hypothetical protein
MKTRAELKAELVQAKIRQARAAMRSDVKATLKASHEVDQIVKALGWSE